MTMWSLFPKEDLPPSCNPVHSCRHEYYKFLLLLCFYLFLPRSDTAFPLQVYATGNGLISNTVYHCYSDSKGYLWIATDKGISRFDGKASVNFTQHSGIGDNINFNFFEDKTGRIWPFAYNGNLSYIRDSKPATVTIPGLPHQSFINAMCADDSGNLYIGYYNGDIYRVHQNRASLLFACRRGDIFLQTMTWEDGLLKAYGNPMWRFFRQGKLWAEHHAGFNKNFLYHGLLYVADTQGIKIYRSDSLLYRKDDARLCQQQVVHLYGDTAGNICCSTYDGLYLFNRHSGGIRHILAGNTVSCCVQDAAGDFRACVPDKGIISFPKNFDAFRLIGSGIRKMMATASGAVFVLRHDSMSVVAIDKNGSRILKRLPIAASVRPVPLLYDSNICLYNAPTPEGMATYCRDLNTGNSSHLLPYYKNALLLQHGLYLAHDRNFLLTASYDGRQLHDTRLHTKPAEHIIICSARQGGAWALLDGTLYYCSRDGVLKKIAYNSNWRAVRQFSACHGRLFMITDAGGAQVYREDHISAAPEHILPYSLIYNVATLPDSSLMCYTANGIYLAAIDPAGIRIKPLLMPVSATGRDFISVSGSDCIIFDQDQLYCLPTSLLHKDAWRPPLIIDRLTVNGRPYDASRPVRIHHTSSCELNLSVGALYFRGANNVLQYRVCGATPGPWRTIRDDQLQLTLSRFGSYQVELRILYDNYLPLTTAPTIRIEFIRPFYRSYLFYLLIALVILGIAAAVFIRRRKEAQRRRLRSLEMEHKAAHILLQPHFVFNAIHNIQGLISAGTGEKANDYLTAVSKLIRRNFENLQFQLVPLSGELDLIRSYIELQNLRFDQKIGLQICDPGSLADTVFIPPLLLHTFVENAVVHGYSHTIPCFCITIDISVCDEQYILLHVTDNGIGLRSGSKQRGDSASTGIESARQRLLQLNRYYKLQQSLLVTDRAAKQEQGTEVVIVLYRSLHEWGKA